MVAVDFEEAAQRRPRIAAAEAICAERSVAARDPVADEIADRAHVVRGSDDGAVRCGQALLDVGEPRAGVRMQPVPAVHLDAFAAQLREAGDAPHVG